MNKLNILRKQIESIDESIIRSLATREKISEAIGQIKRINNMSVRDAVREEKLKARHKRLCKKHKADPVLVKRVFDMIITNSRRIQKI